MKAKQRSPKKRARRKQPPKHQSTEWLADASIREAYRREAESAVRGDDPKLSKKDRAGARLFLKNLPTVELMERVDLKLKRFLQLVEEPDLSKPVDEALAEYRNLLDELVDELLETPEPFRTKNLKILVPIREWFRRED